MSFRRRLLIGSVLLAVVPIVAFATGTRRLVSERLSASFETRVEDAVGRIREELRGKGASIDRRLDALADAIADDNRIRRAVVRGDESERAYLLDYAAGAARLSGLSVLQLQDEDGRILSSAHFRAEFDRLDPELPAAVAAAERAETDSGEDAGFPVLARVRLPDGARLAMLRRVPVRLGGRQLSLLGGDLLDDETLARLAPGPEVAVTLVTPGDGTAPAEPAPYAPADAVTRDIRAPWAGPATARFVVSHSLAPLRSARAEMTRWLLFAATIAAAAALLLAAWLASRLGRPLTELARKTARVDLDRLDVDFSSSRRDEIGALSRLLAGMTERLRASAARLREAERRATLGEIARQVNHDVKNGLVPIRNVFRHLLEVGEREPAELPAVLAERRGTIESGIRYLEGLAANYARLTPRLDLRACDAGAVAREVAAGADAPGVHVQVEAAVDVPAVRADPLALRRVLENLVSNAVESLRESGGRVTLSVAPGGEEEQVRIGVADDGPGIPPEEMDRIFEDFYTTRPGGTGLGLSVVRRLVTDLGGHLRMESRVGEGSRFVVELPAAGGARVERGGA